jgi:5-methylthioribose kinase
MLELDATNVIDYLQRTGVLDRGEQGVAEALGWGVSNAVFRVDTPERSFVLKQSRAQLRTREAWYSNLDRVFREAEVMQALEPLLPPGVVPRVIQQDRENFAFVMSAAPKDHVVWKQLLLDGSVDLTVGRVAGDILGAIHARSSGIAQFAEKFDDCEVFVQLRVEPFYWRMRPRHPELEGAINQIVEEMFHTRVALTHADFSPKNLLVHSEGVTLVDYETGHWGDPAFDLGFFLSHLILKAIKHNEIRPRFLELTQVFWERYRSHVRAVVDQTPALRLDDLTRRAIGHFALCALARVDGTSPVDYLDEPQRQTVRTLTARIIEEAPGCWDTVLQLVLCQS